MNDPKTADQINSQVLGKVDLSPDDRAFIEEAWQAYKSGKVPSRDQMKRNIALRLLVEKWRDFAERIERDMNNPALASIDCEWKVMGGEATTFRQCAKELEETLSGL